MVFEKGDAGYWKGKSRSEETKKKLSATGKGRHYSPATEFKKGRIMPEAEIEKHRRHPSWNKKERVEVECENCHKKYLIISTMQFKRRFCSRSCKAQYTFKGKAKSQEHKKKIGDANKGHLKGVHRSPQTEFKKGHVNSDEVKEKMIKALVGNTFGFKKGNIPWNKDKSGYVLKEVWQSRPQSRKGKNNPKWSGGRKAVKAREHHRRRSLGFIPLNNCDDKNWVAHHLDKDYVLYIPKELHINYRHKLTDQDSMDAINDVVYLWYVKYNGFDLVHPVTTRTLAH